MGKSQCPAVVFVQAAGTGAQSEISSTDEINNVEAQRVLFFYFT
jgi:hypothetical protein